MTNAYKTRFLVVAAAATRLIGGVSATLDTAPKQGEWIEIPSGVWCEVAVVMDKNEECVVKTGDRAGASVKWREALNVLPTDPNALPKKTNVWRRRVTIVLVQLVLVVFAVLRHCYPDWSVWSKLPSKLRLTSETKLASELWFLVMVGFLVFFLCGFYLLDGDKDNFKNGAIVEWQWKQQLFEGEIISVDSSYATVNLQHCNVKVPLDLESLALAPKAGLRYPCGFVFGSRLLMGIPFCLTGLLVPVVKGFNSCVGCIMGWNGGVHVLIGLVILAAIGYSAYTTYSDVVAKTKLPKSFENNETAIFLCLGFVVMSWTFAGVKLKCEQGVMPIFGYLVMLFFGAVAKFIRGRFLGYSVGNANDTLTFFVFIEEPFIIGATLFASYVLGRFAGVDFNPQTPGAVVGTVLGVGFDHLFKCCVVFAGWLLYTLAIKGSQVNRFKKFTKHYTSLAFFMWFLCFHVGDNTFQQWLTLKTGGLANDTFQKHHMITLEVNHSDFAELKQAEYQLDTRQIEEELNGENSSESKLVKDLVEQLRQKKQDSSDDLSLGYVNGVRLKDFIRQTNDKSSEGQGEDGDDDSKKQKLVFHYKKPFGLSACKDSPKVARAFFLLECMLHEGLLLPLLEGHMHPWACLWPGQHYHEDTPAARKLRARMEEWYVPPQEWNCCAEGSNLRGAEYNSRLLESPNQA